MTIGQKTLMIDHLITVNRTFDENLPFREKKEMLKLVRKGMVEVLDNPEKYGLMPIPTEEDIDGWFGDGQEVHDRFWEEAPYRTNGDRLDEIKEAFAYFKNRNIEKAQDNNSGE